MEKDYGRAYAFFDSRASKEEIESDLPLIKSSTQSHPSLELFLMEVKEFERKPEIDSDLRDFMHTTEIHAIFPSAYRHLMKSSKPTKLCNLKYVIEAKNRYAPVEEVASDLSAIMNQVYVNHGEGKPFNVEIIGDVNGQYISWEDN